MCFSCDEPKSWAICSFWLYSMQKWRFFPSAHGNLPIERLIALATAHHSYPLFCQIFHPLQHCLTISGYSKRSGSSNSMISGFLASVLTSVWGSDFSLLTQISPPSGCSCQLNSKKGDLHDPEGLYPYFVNHQAFWGNRIHATLFWRFPKPF